MLPFASRGSDRRSTPRYRLHDRPIVHIACFLKGAWVAVDPVFQDISPEGISFESRWPLPPGATIQARILTYRLAEPLLLSGTLLWSTGPHGPSAFYRYGARFSLVSPAARKALSDLVSSPVHWDSSSPDRRQ